MRQSVYFDRDRRAKKQFTQQSTDEYVKAKRGEYRPLSDYEPGLASAFAAGLAVNAAFAKGEIDEEEMKRRRRAIVDAVK